MARSIMARLGYTPIDAATARHRRRRTLLRRLGNAVMIVALVGAGIVVHNHLPGRVTSAPVTVPAAVHDTLEQGGEQIEGFFRAIGTLRRPGPGERHPDAVIELLPPVRRPWPPSEESATAPFRTA